MARGHVLRRLLLEWTGVGVERARGARDLGPRAHAARAPARDAGAAGVAADRAPARVPQPALGLLREPRLLADRDLSSLRVSAITDPLTGLYNRRFLVRPPPARAVAGRAPGGVVSLLLMDLQGFKAINDRLGHPVGDTVLVKTANVIRDSLRMVDAGCRYGGDEFVAVLPNTDPGGQPGRGRAHPPARGPDPAPPPRRT